MYSSLGLGRLVAENFMAHMTKDFCKNRGYFHFTKIYSPSSWIFLATVMRMSYIFSQTTSLDTGRGLGDVFVWLDSRNKPQEVWQPGRRPRFVTMVPMKNNILHVKFVWFQHTPASHTAFASARQQRDSGSKSSSAIPRFSSTIMLLVQDKQKLAFYTGFVPLLSSFVWPF